MNPAHYPLKQSKYSSHYYLERLGWRDKRVLDVGCGEGFLALRLAERGNRVTGVDILESPLHRDVMEDYVRCDLATQARLRLGRLERRAYDAILLLDVLEHLPRPEEVLEICRELIAPGGEVLLSVPNVANITVRLMLLAGRFEYAERGILDRTHLRFYTRRTFRRLLAKEGFRVEREWMTVMPVELALGFPASHPLMIAANRILAAATRLCPGVFGYQILCLARVD